MLKTGFSFFFFFKSTYQAFDIFSPHESCRVIFLVKPKEILSDREEEPTEIKLGEPICLVSQAFFEFNGRSAETTL